MKKIFSVVLFSLMAVFASAQTYQRFAPSRLVFIPAPADTTPPTLTSATIPSAGNSVTLAFSEPVTFTVSTGWTPTLSGGASAMTYSSGTGTSSLVYNLARTVNSGETGTMAFTQPGTGISDISLNLLATLSGATITNNSTQSAATPAFGAEVMQYANDGSGSTDVITLSGGVSAGNRAVVMIRILDDTATCTSIVDSKGNTWTVHGSVRTQKPSGKILGLIASAHVTSALVASDTITITWATVSGYCARRAAVEYLTGCASAGQPDVFTSNSASFQDNSPTVSGTTATAATATIGMIFENQNVDGASSPSWTQISTFNDTGMIAWHYRNTFSSTGSKTMSSTLGDTCYWGALFVAFK